MTRAHTPGPLGWLVALLAVFALVAAACADDSTGEVSTDDTADDTADDSAPPDDTSEGDDSAPDDTAETDDDTSGAGDDDGPLTASFTGVTEDSITVGISMLDFAFLRETFGTVGWGDQQGVWQALIDDLNDNRGGINGRTLVPIYDAYKAIEAEDAARSCVALTEDNEVFAVLGGFVGPVGTEDPCIVTLHETMLVGGTMTPEELEEARAPWYETGDASDRTTNVLLDLLVESGRSDDATVFLLSHVGAQGDQGDIEDALGERSIEHVESAVLDAGDGDQGAQDSIMQVVSERIRTTGANTVFINGNPSAPLRGLITAGLMSEVTVWSNGPDGLNNLGGSVDRDAVEGVIAAIGATDGELYAEPAMQECIAIVQAAFPDVEIIDPDVIEVDEENWFNAIRRYCRLLSLFEQLATEAGNNLTYDSILEAADSEYFDDFAIPGEAHLSLDPDKPDAQDEFRLGEYSTAESDGALAPAGELTDRFP